MRITITPEEYYFFMAAEAAESPAAKSGFAAAVKGGLVPWERLISDGAAPYLLLRLRAAGLDSELPETARRGLEVSLLKHTGRNTVFLAELDRIVESLNRVSIIPVLLKGAALLNEVYRHPGSRGLSDLDILVDREELARAGGALESLGYGFVHEKGHHRNYSLAREFPVVVELHHSLFEIKNPLHRFAFGLDSAELASRAVPLERDSWRALSLNTEDQVLYLCCHAAKEQFGSLKLLADIYELVKSKNVDWDVVVSRAGEYRVENSVRAALGKLSRSTSLEIPGYESGSGEVLLNRGSRKNGNLSKLFYYLGLIEGAGRKAKAILGLPVYFIKRK